MNEAAKETPQVLKEKETEIPELIGAEVQPTNYTTPIISIENAKNLSVQALFYPFFPEITQISSTGDRAAIGDLSGVKIIDLVTQEVLLQIDGSIQPCHFGFRKYFQFNRDGKFLAIALKDKIQVWQVGGGVIYEASYKNNHILDPLVCGADIPQLALSPDGKLLAESGIRVSSDRAESYFIVTDIIKNSVIYEWEGSIDLPHGHFNTFPELGFSENGTILQTFDPTRFNMVDKYYQHPFRFWSTESWKEIESNANEIINNFSKGELLFTRSAIGSVQVISKISGIELVTIATDGCELDDPCHVKISSDGTKAAVLTVGPKEPYMRGKTISMISTFDLLNGKKIADIPTMYWDLEGVQIDNYGTIRQYTEPADANQSLWWTQLGYFSGFRVINEKSIAFTPQIMYKGEQPLDPYSGSCQIHLEDNSITCIDSLVFAGGSTVSIDKKTGGISISEQNGGNNEVQADIKDPQGELGDLWQYRLLNYAAETEVGFLCVDRNSRVGSCFIMDFPENKIIHDNLDLDNVQYAQKSQTAAFIEKTKKSLYLFFDDKNTLKQIKTYQAYALPIKPAYFSNGNELIYVVQSLEDPKNIYIEKIDAVEGKVIKRYDIEGIKTIEISSISVSPDDNVWIASDRSGKVYIIDPTEQTIIHAFQAVNENIADMIFSQDGTSIFIIGWSGKISKWVVQE